MPGDCHNEITIYGPNVILDIFQEKKLRFSYFVPCVEGVDVEEWNLANWGTVIDNRKNPDPDAYSRMESNLDTKVIERLPTKLCLYVWTLEFPPNAFLKNLIQKYPSIQIKNNWKDSYNNEGIWVGSLQTEQSMKWKLLSQ
jgi:hypothetical protein